MIPPAILLVLIGRSPWVVPIPVPVILLWPLAPVVLVLAAITGDSRGVLLVRALFASRGLRIDVRGPLGERFLLQLL